MSKGKRLTPRPKRQLEPGDIVLVGGRGCMPFQWFLATVLWAEGQDVLTEHVPPSRAGSCEYHRQVLALEDIRAVGTIAELGFVKERCSVVARRLSDEVSAAEQALGRARDAVWAKLEAIGADVLAAAADYAREADAIDAEVAERQAEIATLEADRKASLKRRKEAVGS